MTIIIGRLICLILIHIILLVQRYKEELTRINLTIFKTNFESIKMDAEDADAGDYDKTFLEEPAILDKYKAAADVCESK